MYVTKMVECVICITMYAPYTAANESKQKINKVGQCFKTSACAAVAFCIQLLWDAVVSIICMLFMTYTEYI